MTTRQTTLEEWGMTFEPLEEEQPKPTRQTTIWEWFKDKVRQIEDDVCRKIQARSDKGIAKYGVTMEREDLSITEWLTHLQEEMMDAILYVEKLLQVQPDEEER